jgi:hypothetical protein
MEYKAIVLRGCFTSLKQNDLSVFGKDVVKFTLDKKEYEAIRPAVLEMNGKLEIFQDALTSSKFRDQLAMLAKKEAQKDLITAMHKVANLLDYNANGNVSYILGAGFKAQELRSGARATKKDGLMAPQILGIVVTNAMPGEITVDLTKVVGANNYGFEYSEDGETWKNGQYSSSTNPTIKLPSRKELWLRARAIGTRDRVSEFGEAVKTFVL